MAFQPGDIAAPADYFGNGVTDTAVYRPSTQSFMITGMTNPIVVPNATGASIPVASPLFYRQLGPTLALSVGSDTGFVGDNVTTVRQPKFIGTTQPNVVVNLYVQNNRLVGTTTSDANGNYSVTASLLGDLPNGGYLFKAVAGGVPSQVVPVTLITVSGDFNGDGKSDPAIFRRVSANNSIQWFVQGVTVSGPLTFGVATTDVPFAANISGNGKEDLLVYRESNASWYFESSANGYKPQTISNNYGWAGVDIPVPADYLGLGKDQIALFRPTDGTWFIYGGQTINAIVSPQPGDIPAPADYFGDGKVDPAIYRPSTNQWFILTATGTVQTVSFGGSRDIPVAGAYDATATNKSAEPAFWRPSTGQYFVAGPNGNRVVQFAVGDIPAPGDYFGNGVTDVAVYRPSTGQFWVVAPGSTVPTLLTQFGDSTFKPTLSPYQYRLPTVSSAFHAASIDSTPGSVNIGSTARSLSSGSTTATLTSNSSTTLTPAAATPPRSVNSFGTRQRVNTAQKPVNLSVTPLHNKPLHRPGLASSIFKRFSRV